MMSFNTLMKTPSTWYSAPGGQGDVLIGMMARVVRNLKGHKFPGWSTDESRKAVADIILPVLRALPGNKTGFESEMSKLSYEQRRILLERKQLSHSMAARQNGCHLLINKKQDTTYMVNEEEHLVIHFYMNGEDGFQPDKLLKRAHKTLNSIEKELDIAHTRKDGYQTSLPAECGSGIQLYAVLQLPGLSTAGMMKQVERSMEKLLLNISPFYSELGDDAASMYVVYTAPIVQGGEEEMTAHLGSVVMTLMERELEVRCKVATTEDGVSTLMDKVGRAYGLLKYARRLEYTEALNALTMLRFGLVCGYLEPQTCTIETMIAQIAGSYPLLAPYHMQYICDDPNANLPLLRPLLCHRLMQQIAITTEITDASEYE
jgi:protein arginine kinase